TGPTRGRMIDRAPLSTSPSENITEHDQKTPILTWGDLWFPVLLGLLMFALVFGLEFGLSRARSMLALVFGLEITETKELWLKATLLIGLPAAIAYTFIGRPIRFALGISALLLVGGISRGILHIDLIHQERSFFGVMTVLDKSAESDSPTKF